MMRCLKFIICITIPAIFMAQASVGRTHVIQLGWDIPTTTFLKEHWAAMEQTGPFDGVMFSVEAVDGDNKYDSQWGWDARPWQRAAFTNTIEDLKTCRFTRFRHNFVRLNFSPGSVAWNDDDGWKNIYGKAGILSWVAKEGGARGLALDFETYGEPMFKYSPGGELSFRNTAELARKRGAEFMKAVAAEYPDAVVLPLFMNSINLKAGRCSDPDLILASAHYGLLPAFINGMLDAMPPGLTLVDGCENGYYLDGRLDYLQAANEMRNHDGPAMRLVAPENRVKYRKQVQVGFGFYLDMYLNGEGNRYYRGPKPGGTRLERLHDNLAAASEASDGYVWVYGEQCRWWEAARLSRIEKTVGKGRMWEEALPGITPTIGYVRDPLGAACAEVGGGRIENLARNGKFSTADESGYPTEWAAWQHKESKGTFSTDGETGGGAARAEQVANGCFIQKYAASGGDRFLIRAQCRVTGAPRPSVVARWQHDDQWVVEKLDVTLSFTGGENEWRSCSGVVTVPSEANLLTLLLSLRGQMGEGDVCWFDNVEVYRIPNPARPE